MLIRKVMLTLTFVVVLLLLACGDDDAELPNSSAEDTLTDSEAPTPTPGADATPLTSESGSSGADALWMAESIDSLVSYYPHVIVGTVERLVQTTRQDSQLPDGTVLPGPEVSVFAVSVQEVIHSDGRTLPEEILLGRGGDKPPTVGETYLMFLEDLSVWSGQANYYTGPAFGRFEIDAIRRVVPNGREYAPGVAAVSGASGEQVLAIPEAEGRDQALADLATRTVDEAAAIIRDAATRASPVPTQPPRIAPTSIIPPSPIASDPVASATAAASPTAQSTDE